MLSPLYMAEISPPELRGSLMALEQLAIVFGVVFGFWTGFLTRNSGSSRSLFSTIWSLFFAVPSSASWRVPLAIQFLPGVSLCLGCFLLPPSPRFLVLKGRPDDARASLARLRLRTPDEAAHDPLIQVRMCLFILGIHMYRRHIRWSYCRNQLELLEMQVNVALETQDFDGKEDKNMGSWTRLFHPKYIHRTLIGVMIMFFQRT